jgi:hypothetical protein
MLATIGKPEVYRYYEMLSCCKDDKNEDFTEMGKANES